MTSTNKRDGGEVELPCDVAVWLCGDRFDTANESYYKMTARRHIAEQSRALAESRAEVEALRASMEGDAANHVAIERDRHKARAERLAGALREIATPLDCGCKPCHGHCRNDAWEWMQETARAALEQEPQE